MMRRLRLDRTGSSAAEFALVLPLLILFLFGIIDGGRFLWETNKAEKATQAGARVAVVTDVISTGLGTQNYVGVGGLTQGDLIPASALGTITCTRTACTCTGSCPTSYAAADSASFDRIVQRMSFMKPDIAASNVTVSYRGSGLGFAGDPNGMEISPLVTVTLSNVQFRPLILFNSVAFNLPAFTTTLTAEDSAGTVSN
jgi:Flp pilus assembly protein TadG